MPPGSDRFTWRDDLDEARAEDLAVTRSLSLVERADRQRPPVPPLTTKGTEVHRGRVPHEPRTGKPKSARRLRMPEFIEQKREIFRISLMVNRKRREMQDLDEQVDVERADFQATERYISDTANEYKMRSVRCERELATARIKSEGATRVRMEKQKELKLLTQSVAAIRSEIIRNEDTLECFRRYGGFLTMLGVKDALGAVDGEYLLTEFDEMERANLFLIEQYDEVRGLVDLKLGQLANSLQQTDHDLDSLAIRQREVPVVGDSAEQLTEADARRAEGLDAELVRVTRLIRATYVSCFGNAGDVSTMAMLEQIENALEQMYRRVACVSPAFVHKKQKKKDEMRLEARRIETQARKNAEMKTKMEQALERSRMPVAKRTGRPMVRRMLPIVGHRIDEEKTRADLVERQRIETLLFEDTDSKD
jgi:hypothetical protein